MTLPKYAQKRPLNTMELNRMMDHSLKAELLLKYEIKQAGERRKLIGTNEKYKYRGFAYFTTCLEPARQALRMELSNIISEGLN